MRILVLPGDGIGPEITDATLAVLDRANDKSKLGLEWQIEEIGFAALKISGATLPQHVMDAARNAAGVILGPISHLDWMAPRHRNNALAGAVQRIEQAVDAALAKPATRTPDLGGRLGTQAFAAEGVSRI